MSGLRWLVAVHALDRTGPPVLARSWIRWCLDAHPEDDVQVVAMRNGELLDSFLDLCPTRVLLAPHEGWDPAGPSGPRGDQFAEMLADLTGFDAVVLFSISAAQVLPFLPSPTPPVVAWTLEHGEDLHWFRTTPELMSRVDHWIVGAEGTRDQLRPLLGADVPIALAPEFVDPPVEIPVEKRENCRAALGVPRDALLVMGAGIATMRKAPDLFLEVALAAWRQGADRLRFVWMGGEQDELFPLISDEALRLGLSNFRVMGSVTDIHPWFAAADVLLHPARVDAFPLVCLHAAGLGTPVVAFEESIGVAEMFGDDFAGASYPDVEALAEVVASLVDDEARADLAARQRARVTAAFTATTAAPILYDELVGAIGGRAT